MRQKVTVGLGFVCFLLILTHVSLLMLGLGFRVCLSWSL